MLEYDRIDISEGIDVNKNILTSKKCLYVLIMSRTSFRVNPHSIVA